VRTIASYHHKGGVGKTTTAVALAAHAADGGSRTLLWDLDPQGAATRLLGADRGLEERVGEVIRHGGQVASLVVPTAIAGLDLVPADPSLRTLDRRLDDGHRGRARIRRALGGETSYDVVVLDCPPSVSLTAAAVLEAADLVVVPLTAGPLAWSAFADLFAEIDAMDLETRPGLLAFLTMVDRRKGLHRDLVDGDEPPEGFSSVIVPTDSRVERMAIDDRPLRAVLTGRAGRAYGELWAEIDGGVQVDAPPTVPP
jgi:chromosome partitioning protein